MSNSSDLPPGIPHPGEAPKEQEVLAISKQLADRAYRWDEKDPGAGGVSKVIDAEGNVITYSLTDEIVNTPEDGQIRSRRSSVTISLTKPVEGPDGVSANRELTWSVAIGDAASKELDQQMGMDPDYDLEIIDDMFPISFDLQKAHELHKQWQATGIVPSVTDYPTAEQFVILSRAVKLSMEYEVNPPFPGAPRPEE